MLKIVNKTINSIFGNKSKRDLKALLPYVEQVNKEWKQLQGIDNDQLRAKTEEIKNTIDKRLESIDAEINNIKASIGELLDHDIEKKEDLFKQIDKLESDRDKELEVVLLEVLPITFAVVKETAKRFAENEIVEVTANELDQGFASQKPYVEINGEKACWKNEWEAAGNLIKWNMVHYDVQLIGGVVLHQGKIAEMATGEGKTLVATLPAFLNALARRGVHIVTVNDYLAKRDSEWMAPIFEFHGMTVDCIDKYEAHSENRRKAYKADVTYGTNNEFGFDYLRDNMVSETDEIVQKKHHFAMIDEVDSVLIDDARTPLIISGPVPRGDEHEYFELKPIIQKLVDEQKRTVQAFLNDAKKLLKAEKVKEVGLPLFRAYRGLPKSKPLIKLLSESGVKTLMQKTENIYLAENSKLMPEADKPLLFTIDEKHNQIDLTDKGLEFLAKNNQDENFFVLPDVGSIIGEIENNTDLTVQEQLEKKEEVLNEYSIKGQRIHSINQLLKAYTLFEKEVDYIIVDNEVKIVDEQTGRTMHGRRYSDGLHQALEAKENVKIQDATQTYATITLQNYFRMYHKLSGMTGTAETESTEFWEIYKLDVVVIPTNLPIQRKDKNDLVFKTEREKYNAIVKEVVKLSNEGRPVLVGTTSVESSELLSRMIRLQKIEHQVLNAKHHQKEAEIVANAGQPGVITIATNMAGRGTDIKLNPSSKEAGGLAILGTERHESRRVDRQLRGRSGRQGDPGSSQFFVSLEDGLMRMFGSGRVAGIMDRMGLKEGEVIQHSWITKTIERAQKKVEENYFGTRKQLLEYDDVMNEQRKIIYKRRKNALFGERLELDILNSFYETTENIINNYKEAAEQDNAQLFEELSLQSIDTLGIEVPFTLEEFNQLDSNSLIEKLYEAALNHYDEKNNLLKEKLLPILKDLYAREGKVIEKVSIPFTDGKKIIEVVVNLEKIIETDGQILIKELEKTITLAIIDHEWKDHLRDMDDLRQGVRTAVYQQKDPLVVYKFESFELFQKFVARMNEILVTFLIKGNLEESTNENQSFREARKVKRRKARFKEQKASAGNVFNGDIQIDPSELSTNAEDEVLEKVMPAKSTKISRNAKVNVKYKDGTVKKNVKYKSVERDIKNGDCEVI